MPNDDLLGVDVFATLNPKMMRVKELGEVMTALGKVPGAWIVHVDPDGTMSYGRRPLTRLGRPPKETDGDDQVEA